MLASKPLRSEDNAAHPEETAPAGSSQTSELITPQASHALPPPGGRRTSESSLGEARCQEGRGRQAFSAAGPGPGPPALGAGQCRSPAGTRAVRLVTLSQVRRQQPRAPRRTWQQVHRGPGRKPRARSASAFSPGARGAPGPAAGSARGGSPRASGARSPAEVAPGASRECPGAQPPRPPPGLGLQRRGAGRGGLEGAAAGAGGRGRPLFTSFPNSPPSPRPAAAREAEVRGEAGAPLGLRDPSPQQPPPPARAWGWGRPACAQVPIAPRGGPAAPPPRVQRALRLGMQRSRRPRLAPRRARGWIRGVEGTASKHLRLRNSQLC